MKPHKKNLTATYNLKILAPQLAEQWHPTKNAGMSPEQVTPGSGRKVWWQCEQGHEWEASPHLRRNNLRCPICSNRRVSFSNNLAIQNPRLAAEWHPTQNGELTPHQVVPGSGKKVWWLCDNGHEWKARIVDRANGRGCDKCRGHKAHAAHNLAITFPGLAKEWHPSKNGELTPFLVTPRSNQKVWWQCSRGHEWASVISNRAKGQNCPDCTPNTSFPEIRIFSELKAIFAQVEWRKRFNRVECDVLLPDYSVAIEYDGAFWHKPRAQQDERKNAELRRMGITVFRVREMELSETSSRDIILSTEETRTGGITIVQRLLRKIVENIRLHSHDLEKVVEYLRRTSFINSKEYRRIVSCLPGPVHEESLAGRFPHIAKQWHPEKNHPLTPEMFSPGTPRNVWWLCEKGHEWRQRINHRANGVGCPYCAGQKADLYNNLAVKRPDIATQWHPTDNGSLRPSMFTPYSNKRVWWICTNGHKWQASIHNRSKGTGCPHCAGKKVGGDYYVRIKLSAQYNLAIKFPNLAEEWHPNRNGNLAPEHITPGSDRKVWWRCRIGHEWEAVVSSRVTGVGCPYCAGKKATRDHNLDVMFPEIAKQWHPTKNGNLMPSDALPGSDKRMWWICKKGHEWRAPISRRTGGSGCPDCSGTRVTTLNNLAMQFPEIAKQWHPTKNEPLEPQHVRPGSNKKVWWICERGHEWQRTVQQQVKIQRCPICDRQSLAGISLSS